MNSKLIFILISLWFLATMVKKNSGSSVVLNDNATTIFSDKRQISDRKILRPPLSFFFHMKKIFFFTTVVKALLS